LPDVLDAAGSSYTPNSGSKLLSEGDCVKRSVHGFGFSLDPKRSTSGIKLALVDMQILADPASPMSAAGL
jgi:hypothetical protein